MFWISGPFWLWLPFKSWFFHSWPTTPENSIHSPTLLSFCFICWLPHLDCHFEVTSSKTMNDPQLQHFNFDTCPPISSSGLLSDQPCQSATHISAWWVPMERVMTLSFSRTSLTIMLFWRGVERQHRTDWQYWVNSRNFFSSFPWKMALSVFPSMTNPTSGAAAPEAGGVVLKGRWNPKSLWSGFRGP